MTEPTPPAERRARWPLVVLVLFAGVLALPLATFQVREHEVAIKSTFGRYGDAQIQPGLHFKWPWPVQKVHLVDKRQRVLSTEYLEVTTADDYNLVISLFATWQVSDPRQYLLTGDAEAERVLADQIRTERSTVFRSHPVSHLISTDPAELRFRDLRAELQERVQQTLAAKGYGIDLVYLGIEHIALPETVTRAVFDRMTSERQSKAAAIVQQGETAAVVIRNQAEAEAKRTVVAAESEAMRLRGQADSDAAEAYKTLNRNAPFAIFLRKLEALEATIGKDDTLILDRAVPPFDLLGPLPAMPASK